MSDFKITAPVAFLIYNRPDKTARVFEQIAKAQPSTLLVVGDGPRATVEGDLDKVAKTRALIEQVDWPCQVLTNYSDVNLGCKVRVASGLDWVFEQVPEAIILEDDCFPDITFFRFCQELLDRYRSDQRVGLITGSNSHLAHRFGQDSYYFSKYGRIWGWASWRDRWQSTYDVNMRYWPEIRNTGLLLDIFGDVEIAAFWQKTLEYTYEGKIDTWDYQWFFANWIEGRVCIQPSFNLISNIGCDADAAHLTKPTSRANMRTAPIRFPLEHPIIRIPNSGSDKITNELASKDTRELMWPD